MQRSECRMFQAEGTASISSYGEKELMFSVLFLFVLFLDQCGWNRVRMEDMVGDDEVRRGRLELDDHGTWNFILSTMTALEEFFVVELRAWSDL